MNKRNISALERLVSEWENLDFKSHGRAPALSVWLASRGVLVPSALTDEQANELVVFDAAEDWRTGEAADEVRAELERIAKGEDE